MTAVNLDLTTITPTESDVRLARASSQRLRLYVQKNQPLRITAGEGHDGTVEIPAAAAALLLRVLNQMAQGHAVTVLPSDTELTTQKAADILGVSRPFVVKEIKENRLPARNVGTRRRITLGDVLAYKKRSDANRQRALDDLAKLDQELGIQ
jgi:excisionase family DNA binding protein